MQHIIRLQMFENYFKFVKFDYLVSFKTDILFYVQGDFKVNTGPQEVYIKTRFVVVVL